MKNILYIGSTGTGKTYNFFKNFGNKKFLALSPCRQLTYEMFMKYGSSDNSLINGEVHHYGKDTAGTFAVYENAIGMNLSDYEVVFIDEFHFITDADRGALLYSIIIECNKLGILVVGATATNNINSSELDELNLEVKELQPYEIPAKKIEIEKEQFYDNCRAGMSSIIFTMYTPSRYDAEELAERYNIDINTIAILSSAELPSKKLQTQLDFESGKIKVIISTNIIAQGLNFPAQQVMIYYNPYDSDEIIEQKLGRLGRPGYGYREVYYTAVADTKIYKKNINKNSINKETTYLPYLGKNLGRKFENFIMFYSLNNYKNYRYSYELLIYLLDNKDKYLSDVELYEVQKALNTLQEEEKKIKNILKIN